MAGMTPLFVLASAPATTAQAGSTPLRSVAAGRWQDRYARKNWKDLLTKLSPEEEAAFQDWARKSHAPITDDYDMRGFWKSGGATSINQNDGLPHYTDTFKTPLHQTFSGESVFADPSTAPPTWNDLDQLVGSDGKIIFDERRQLRRK